jgi:spore germination protein KB
MIRLSDGKIGSREFVSIVILTFVLKVTDTTPTFLFLAGENAGWLLPALSALIIFISFSVLLSVLSHHPGKGLLDLIYELTGRQIGCALGALLFINFLMVTAINTRSYMDIVNVMVYQKTPVPVLYFILMIAVCYLASRGLETIGRVAWIVLPYLYGVFLLLFVFVWEFIDWLHLFPLAGPGVGKLAKESIFHSSIFGEIFYLALLIPYVRTVKDFRIGSKLGFILSVLKIVAIMAVYIAVFDYPTINEIAYPFQQLTKTAHIGQVITHVESIFLFFWMVSTIIHFSIYIYLLAFLLGTVLRIQQFKKLIVPLSGLVYFLGLIPTNMLVLRAYRGYLIEWHSLFYILFPFLLWALSRWKRRESV